jgi:hypothetical protein
MRAPYRFITYGWLDMILGGDGALYPSGHGAEKAARRSDYDAPPAFAGHDTECV